ncbi:hypothetical protein RHMOL_Rhmol04G0256200 [Rhododendron molle]|uniref:Uncharacterized protein n=1 Tax=Rhododendron molle TaxID=49168 RepID=A0ACC0P4B6_RHOML|nr:hypothetical protein RHMOL_Rhmol04G0256200 [Rhododendron molle]
MVTSPLDSGCKLVSIQHICCIDTAFVISGSSAFGLRLGIHRPRPPDGSLNLHFRASVASIFVILGLERLHDCSKLQNHALFNDLPTKRNKLPYVQYHLKWHFILDKSDKLMDLKHQELHYWVLITCIVAPTKKV